MNKLFKKTVALSVFSVVANLSHADLSKIDTSPPKDPGVIHKERVVYWLMQRGELASDASQSEIDAAFSVYAARAKDKPLSPYLVSLEKQAQKRADKQNSTKKQQKSAANTTVKVLSVLIDFPDLPYNNNRLNSGSTDMYYSDYTVQHYQDLQFSTTGYDGPSGQNLLSGYQFYQSESGGTFFFTGNTFGWVTATNNASFYGGNDPDDDDSDKAVPDLIKEAVEKAVAANSIDLSEYDLEDPYDRDGDGDLYEPDGFIDHVMVYHSSVGEEAGGGVLNDDAIWSHRFFVNQTGNFNTMGYEIPGSGKRVFGYTVQPIDAAAGVVVHEFGHDLGLKDEYDTGNSSVGSPVGHWSVMSAGSWAGTIPGTQPVGFSALARDFFQQKFVGDWVDQPTINLTTLESGAVDYTLVEAVDHGSPFVNQVRIDIPGPVVPFKSPYAGSYQYYSGQGHDLTNTMSFDVSLPSATSISMTMKAHWDIEKDWDLVMVKVNGTPVAGNHTTAVNPYTGQYAMYSDVAHYVSDKSLSISGAEGPNGWVDLTYDLSAFSNQTVTIEFEYRTDSNTGGYGFAVDNLVITADSSTVVNDGAETLTSYTFNGFSRITNASSGASQNYWIQLRSTNGIDQGLAAENYTPGVVMWLGNSGYSDNKVGEHPGYGFVGVIDANQNLIGSATTSSTTQMRDAAFTINDKSLFKDVDDYSRPAQPQSGLVLTKHGIEMEIISQQNDSSMADIQIRKVVLALTADFASSVTNNTVSLTNQSYGGSGSLSFSWDFGDGNTSIEMAPSHTYSQTGSYQVGLTVTDGNANTHSISKDVVVGQLPDADFSFSASNLNVTFTNSSSGGFGSISYSWDFGDGGSSTSQSPTHAYSSAGTYTVVLTMTDGESNTDTVTKSVTVSAPASSSGGGYLGIWVLLGLMVVRRFRSV